jgi:hypothetical protein
LRPTKVLQSDGEIGVKLKAARDKLKIARSPSSDGERPESLQAAGEHLLKNMAVVAPPAVCAEHEGIFYFVFSDAHSAGSATNFLSGFAIKRGERTIYSWRTAEPGPARDAH